MRATRGFLLLIWAGMLAFAPELAAQNKDVKDASKEKKDEIGGKRLFQWIEEIGPGRDVVNRQLAIRTVCNFGTEAKAAVPALLTALQNQDINIRLSAAAALGTLATFDNGIDAGDVPKVVSALITLLGGETQRIVRMEAIETLANLGPRARAAIGAIAKAAEDPTSWELRRWSCVAMGRIGADAQKGSDPAAATCMIGRLSDSCARVRLEAIMALGMMRMPTPALADSQKRGLEKLLKDPDREVQVWARVLLMFVDKTHPMGKSLDELARMIHSDPDPNVRTAAVRGIGALYMNKELIPLLGQRAADLLKGLQDSQVPVILTTIATIGGLGENATPAHASDLARYLTDGNPQIRYQAAHSIGNLGTLARPHVPAMIALLVQEKDKDTTMVLTLLSSFVQLGVTAEPCLAHLNQIAESHKEERIRQAAAETIKQITAKLKKK